MRLLDNACACGSAEAAVRMFYTQDHNFKATRERAWLMRCPECGSLFPERFPSTDTLGQAYAVYYTQAKSRRGLRRWLRALADASRAEHLLRSTPPTAKAVLDYGCGSGEYLRHLRAQGFEQAQLSGTDIVRPQGPGTEAFEWLALDDYDAHGRRFDWITLSHVIEHLPDPAWVMSRLRAACLDNGGVWISTPNADSVLIRSFAAYARDVDFPRHRQIFSRRALQLLLQQSGFEVGFQGSPRVDALLNGLSCARNLWRDPQATLSHRLTTLLKASWSLLVHLLKPAAARAADAPEIVIIAKPCLPPEQRRDG